MNRIAEDILKHYGMPRRSGRYPWGSGGDPYQRNSDFISRVSELKKSGMKEADIATAVGLKSTSQLRAVYSNASNERRAYDIARCKSLKADGKSDAQISRETGIPERTVASLMNPKSEARTMRAIVLTTLLRNQVNEKGMIDVGEGVERELNASKEKMAQALRTLEAEGYPVYSGRMDQVTNPSGMEKTTNKVLCPPGTVPKDIYKLENIHTINDYIIREDAEGNDVVDKAFVYPRSMDSSRIKVRYGDEGGTVLDGKVEIRRNVEDLSLGESRYAQVRILVDGDKYIKGMAVYSDKVPEGYDVVFNTNKKEGTPIGKVLKPIDLQNQDNPFNSLIKEKGGQSYYIDKDGNRVLSLINKTREEGDWNEWKNGLSAQFLSKQPMPLINKQLGLAVADKQAELSDILALTNPCVQKRLLQSFADDCDSSALHLRAASLPRQRYQVILPFNEMGDNEVFAPNWKDGETVALVRYPHGGTFEIPILKVNNKNPDVLAVMGSTPSDAIGINSKVAQRLSGADFDGDTVMVVPCNSASSNVHILSTPALKGLENFDAKMQYGADPNYTREDKFGKEYCMRDGREFKRMTKGQTQVEMGKISNLITDMTIKGAGEEAITKAVKHSMVVIDAQKHKLDFRQSEVDNNIAALKKEWQGIEDEEGKLHTGASTLISKSKSEIAVLKRIGSPRIDPETGEVTYKTNPKLEYTDKNGNVKLRMQKSYLMDETKDARTLSSGTVQEEAYADFANKMKALGNEARKVMLATPGIEFNPSANVAYQQETASLKAKLNLALLNAPRERAAQRLANINLASIKEDNPDMTKKELRKRAQQELKKARVQVKAERAQIKISDREWAAIQSGAIHTTLLDRILQHTDIDVVRELATPRQQKGLSGGKIAKIKAMSMSGYTTSDIAEAVGISSSTVLEYMKKGKE